MKRRITLSIIVSSFAICGLSQLGCESHNTVAERAARGNHFTETSGILGRRLNRVYDYYPDAQVYHSVFQCQWYWRDGKKWRHNSQLPAHIVLNEARMVTLEMSTPKPQRRHDEVLAKCPPGPTSPYFDEWLMTMATE